jgi:long-subunit fatty acid transport protein
MLRLARAVLLFGSIGLFFPQSAIAGGPEFPGGGTRSLGRGAAAMARADDPSLMVRNPALLAELWDDQAMIGAHLSIVDACFQPTGYYGFDELASNRAAIQLGDDEPIAIQIEEGATTLDGRPITPFFGEPYPEVCYEGPAPFLPQVGLTMKLSDDLGVGLGFFPPDNATTPQWGNRDGTVDTPNGLRPNPIRFYRSHMNATFFTLLGAVGYRLADWISVGAGFQWNLAVFSARTWTTPQATPKPLHNDIMTEVFGRDLFIPGFTASVQIKPADSLDIALGFRWSDRVKARGKLDITTGVWGTGEVFEYLDAEGMPATLGSSIPTTSHNRPGIIDSPPVWVPQLSAGIRFSDRLKPRPNDWKAAHDSAGRKVEDHMETERWDIELDGVYYFNSVFDTASFRNSTEDSSLSLRNINAAGVVGQVPSTVGQCLERDPVTQNCIGDRITETQYNGKEQFSVRLGGDYNVLPGMLALRAGISYETDGQGTKTICLETGRPPAPGAPCMRTGQAHYLNVLYYMLGRTGLHAGFTIRVADKTDISFAFAHFIQKDIRLQLNPESVQGGRYAAQFKTAKYHFAPGAGIDAAPAELLPAGEVSPPPADFDGNAGVDISNGDAVRTDPGPHYVNAGSYYYNLDVLSLTVTQHF